jgi:hypothetical protein
VGCHESSYASSLLGARQAFFRNGSVTRKAAGAETVLIMINKALMPPTLLVKSFRPFEGERAFLASAPADAAAKLIELSKI